MKKTIVSFFLGSLVLTGAISCGKDKPVTSENNEVTTTREGSVYKVDTMNSKIEWKGFKILKSDATNHFGTIKFESGDVTVKDGKLESGKFVADMNEEYKVQEENNVLLYTIRHFDADSDKVVSKEKELLRQTVRETLQIVVKA